MESFVRSSEKWNNLPGGRVGVVFTAGVTSFYLDGSRGEGDKVVTSDVPSRPGAGSEQVRSSDVEAISCEAMNWNQTHRSSLLLLGRQETFSIRML